MNFNRMTIRQHGSQFAVFKMKRTRSGGYVTDMAAQRFVWHVSAAATPRKVGTHAECSAFIAAEGAEFMSEHGLPV